MRQCRSAEIHFGQCADVVLSSIFQFGNQWYENKTTEELILYLGKYNIHEEDIYADFENQAKGQNNYYDILGIAFDADADEIKEAFRNWR
jgi:hypothetical protein